MGELLSQESPTKFFFCSIQASALRGPFFMGTPQDGGSEIRVSSFNADCSYRPL